MRHEIYQPKVEAMKRMHDIYMEAVSNGSVRYRSAHTTPDGTRWDLVLEPLDQSALSHWSYLGIASKVDNPDYYKHFGFTMDRVYWDRLQPEDMLSLIKFDLDKEWE